MSSFADSLRASIEADARAHSGAQALPGTRRTIGRRRAVATAGYGAGSALAIGSVAVAAATWGGPEEPTPASSLSPLPQAEAGLRYANVDLTGPLLGQAWDGRALICGEPAPVPTATDQGFTAEFEYTGDGHIRQGDLARTDNHQATVTLSSELDEKLPAHVHNPQAVFVKDGVVAGAFPSAPERQWHMTSYGWQTERQLDYLQIPSSCEQGERAMPLPAGEYDMYIVSKVAASEAAVAFDAAMRAGFLLPPAQMLDTHYPGSEACEHLQHREAIGTPLSCDPTAMPGASIDFDAATATIPYESFTFTRGLDVTLASEPFPVRVGEYDSLHD